jgi:phage tail sheath protein FI
MEGGQINVKKNFRAKIINIYKPFLLMYKSAKEGKHMGGKYTYPGVYIEEVPSGVKTITGVATSITAFIGPTKRGLVNEPQTINNFGEFKRIFGGLWVYSPMSYSVRDFFLNGGNQAIIVRIYHPDSDTNLLTKARLSIDNLELEAANEGSWGNKLRARIDYDVVGEDAEDLFNLSVLDGDTRVVEMFRNVSVRSNHRRKVDIVLKQESKLVRVYDKLPEIRPAHSGPDEIGIAPQGKEFLDEYSSGVQDNMASDGLVPIKDTYLGNKEQKQGLFALEKIDMFNLLCIPPYSLDQDVGNEVLKIAASYCEEHRAIFLIDSPSSWNDAALAKKGINDIPRSKNAAIFFPRFKQQNPEREDRIETFAPCGAVAGLFARTDARRGVWKTPAGQEANLVGAKELSVPLTDTENGELNPLGINCLRTMPPAGLIIWGARTLMGDDRFGSEWKYIPVRRLALFIEESLYRGTKWVVFEPNDEPLWAQIRLNVGTFMHSLFRQGAFQGTTPDKAYFVKCDSETTTQDDVNKGIVNILVGFAPLKPAEFVVIKISQIAGKLGGE